MPYARPATVADAYALAPRLRAEDIAEVKAFSGNHPLQSLLNGVLEGSGCWSAIGHEGQVVAMFGINHMPEFGEDQAAVWMLASPDLVTIKADLFAQTPQWLDYFHSRFALLWNFVDARNELHLKWLRRCGFVFIKLHPRFGVEQRPFYEFVRLPPCVNPSPLPA